MPQNEPQTQRFTAAQVEDLKRATAASASRNENVLRSITLEISNNLEEDKVEYSRLKNYFEAKKIEHSTEDEDLLILFHDETLRIMIGYKPDEFINLFPDFVQGNTVPDVRRVFLHWRMI